MWIYREHALDIYLFDGQQYRESNGSLAFPGIPVGELIPQYMRRAWQIGSSAALRQFESALKDL